MNDESTGVHDRQHAPCCTEPQSRRGSHAPSDDKEWYTSASPLQNTLQGDHADCSNAYCIAFCTGTCKRRISVISIPIAREAHRRKVPVTTGADTSSRSRAATKRTMISLDMIMKVALQLRARLMVEIDIDQPYRQKFKHALPAAPTGYTQRFDVSVCITAQVR